MRRKGSILFLTEISFYPFFGGEKIRSYGLLKILSESFDHVYAITGLKERNEKIGKMFPNVTFIYFDFRTIQVVISQFGFVRQFRRDKTFLARIDEVLNKENIETAFIDYKYYGQYIGYLKKLGLKVIYGTHNVQSRIIWQKPSKKLNEFILYKTYYLTHLIHEMLYFRRADRIITVSGHDASYYGRYIKKSKIVTIPNFIDEELYPGENSEKEGYIVMTANFLAYQNFTGISWFLNSVWSSDLWGRARLVFAGIGSKEVLSKLNRDHQTTNIDALGEMDDLKDVISHAKVAIVPLLDGSGTRLKCIEAMALKTQIISTSRGAEGIEHEGAIVIADEPGEFRQKLIDILDNKTDTVEEAYRIFLSKYSLSANLRTFQSMLEGMEAG